MALRTVIQTRRGGAAAAPAKPNDDDGRFFATEPEVIRAIDRQWTAQLIVDRMPPGRAFNSARVRTTGCGPRWRTHGRRVLRVGRSLEPERHGAPDREGNWRSWSRAPLGHNSQGGWGCNAKHMHNLNTIDTFGGKAECLVGWTARRGEAATAVEKFEAFFGEWETAWGSSEPSAERGDNRTSPTALRPCAATPRS